VQLHQCSLALADQGVTPIVTPILRQRLHVQAICILGDVLIALETPRDVRVDRDNPAKEVLGGLQQYPRQVK
jgi:hypothetical protein